ncbi:MAG: hypothetical protein K8L91_06470 [Anaerolineae bacterium]|nr:hypothetical protein [Anaerolineae bacterium]
MPIEARQAEFALLQQKAYAALEDIIPSSKTSHFLMRLSIYPAFFKYVSWVIFESHNLFVRQVIWNRPGDFYRFFDPMEGLRKGWHTTPTLSVAEKKIDESVFYPLFNQAHQILVPKTERSMAIDGEAWYLHVPSSFENRILDWNAVGCKTESNWQPLTEWAKKLHEFFLAVFNLH